MFDSLSLSQQDLKELSESLRIARFQYLLNQSNGLLQDTWCEDSGKMRYWPGGKSNWDSFFELCDEELRLISEFCETNSCSLVGVGSGRIVISPDGKEIVFKVARYGMSGRLGNGRECNKLEIERWEIVGQHPLTEVLSYADDFSWLCMPRAETLDEYIEKANVRPEYKTYVCSQIKSQIKYLDCIPTVDVRDVNVGLIEGNWKLIDYGKPDSDADRMYGLFPNAIHMFVQ